MDYFNDVLTTFLGIERACCVAVYAGSKSSWISSKKDLMGLEQHEVDYFVCELSI